MSKSLKYILFGVIGIFLLAFGISFFQGFSKSFNPSGAIKMAERKKAESVNVYVPTNYTLTTKTEARESDHGILFVTDMVNGDKKIRIMQGDKEAIECNGQTVELGNLNVCLFDFGKIPSDLNSKMIRFNKNNKTYQIELNDKGLSNSEISQIIVSL
jgi:hypothetical protein